MIASSVKKIAVRGMDAGTPGCDAGSGKSKIAMKMFPARPSYADMRPVIRSIDRRRAVRYS
jgi:hypothetical protein